MEKRSDEDAILRFVKDGKGQRVREGTDAVPCVGHGGAPDGQVLLTCCSIPARDLGVGGPRQLVG